MCRNTCSPEPNSDQSSPPVCTSCRQNKPSKLTTSKRNYYNENYNMTTDIRMFSHRKLPLEHQSIHCWTGLSDARTHVISPSDGSFVTSGERSFSGVARRGHSAFEPVKRNTEICAKTAGLLQGIVYGNPIRMTGLQHS